MFQNLFLQIVSGILGLYLATRFIAGVELVGDIKSLALAGVILGVINCFIRPVLRVMTSPLRMITFGLSSLVINMGIVWAVADVLFPEALEIRGILPLFWTTLIIWGLSILLSLTGKGKIKNA